MKQTARAVAFQTLSRVYQDGAYTNVALQHALSTSNLAPRDKGLCTELVYGTIRRQITVDALLQSYVKRRLSDLDPEVLTILRMSVYQLAFLARVPAYAVIDEAVELAKRHVRSASGLVNGVLRSFGRDDLSTDEKIDRVIGQKRVDDATRLGIRYGYPTWMVKRFVKAYGFDRASAILQACNEPAPLTIRVNTLKTSVETMTVEMGQSGAIEVGAGRLSPYALTVHSTVDVETFEWYQQGYGTVQDEGAMLIAPLLHPAPGEHILDMCAAPGGKTTHIAELQEDRGYIDAYDVYLQKVKTIQAAARRLGLQSITSRLGDGRDLKIAGKVYDAILVDAPCSGLGVMRRRPDIRHRRTASDITALSKLQVELLGAACRVVRSGGIVVYATCTLLPEENEQVVQTVLNEFAGTMTLEDISADVPALLRDDIQDGLVLTPERFGTDGFYMARLRKK
ncbi:16S rRNA (cytosine(967)-C(5))-methyltransferase RsmB [Alicyclobacillus dauci]|uniref:16S rRNA (cytosine(967)-C(5))-methyltransferase n=1 Tax=Alicyclobacillus dauci TaxID=1475485 RepID=A0ABY6YZE7_9BACL|nr:16S rRNA (cytosine(967)-C(5))-methyltransferase RsmB [Alicyclobacillus dauci]WAH35496.1 16S rRNA (cytosine(967)-C(5))-methyltransferase RsmB [Alicyclobacillus dauci]